MTDQTPVEPDEQDPVDEQELNERLRSVYQQAKETGEIEDEGDD